MHRTRNRLAALAVSVLLTATAGQAQSPPPASSGARITPNFKDADITQVIEMVATATGKNFIIDPRVRAQVTMLSATPMTPAEFYQAFLAILSVHDFVAIPSGNLTKIIPSANMRQLPGNDLGSNVSSTSDELVTQIVPVKSVSAASLVATLRPLMPQTANLGVITGSNLLIFTDRANNVSRMMRIIQKIDQAGNSDIDVIPLQNATAADTARTLNSLVGTAGGGTDANGTPVRIVADDRSNSIFVSGDSTQRLRVKALVSQLDSPVDSGSETRVRRLVHADAEALATKLKESMSSSGASGSSTATQNRVVPVINAQGQAVPGTAAGASSANTASTLTLAGGTATIWADKDTNSLVMTAPARTMKALNAVIDGLDIRRAQVLVEAIIVEVTAQTAASLGVNWVIDASASKLGAGGFTAPVVSGSNSPIVDLYGLAKGTSTTIPSGAVFGLGRMATSGVNFAAILQALQTDSRNNIIATPFTTTQDNVEAKLSASRQVPFVTGQYTGTTGTTSAFQTIQRQDVGTILTVTPRINNGNTVLMKLDVESSQLESTRTSGAADLITNKRSSTSTVLVKDDDTLVLGGFISDGSEASESRVPYLGRIPVLGELFRTRSKSHDKRVLMIFVHPRILRSDEDGQSVTDSRYDQMREQQKALNRETTVLPLINKKGAPTLPANQRAAGSSSPDGSGSSAAGTAASQLPGGTAAPPPILPPSGAPASTAPSAPAGETSGSGR